MESKPNLNALTDSNAFEAPDKMEPKTEERSKEKAHITKSGRCKEKVAIAEALLEQGKYSPAQDLLLEWLQECADFLDPFKEKARLNVVRLLGRTNRLERKEKENNKEQFLFENKWATLAKSTIVSTIAGVLILTFVVLLG